LASHLVAVIVPVGTNKPIDKNAAPHHSGSDQDAEGGNPYE